MGTAEARPAGGILGGALAALVAGSVMVALAASAGGLAESLTTIVALTASLMVAGTTYGWLVQSGRMRVGFGPGILFWCMAFPLARLAQELMVVGGGGEAGLSQGVAGFLAYQAMVGGAFGLGFFLLHGQITMLLRRAGSGRESAGGGGGAR
jgi:hypothetical protein